MIQSFLDDWDLFGTSYVAAWLIGVLLAAVGCFAVVRNRIFLGAAIAQASTLGIAVGLWVSAMLEEHMAGEIPGWETAAFAVAFSVFAAVFSTSGRGTRRGETAESRTGWIFLFASSASILAVMNSPHGTEQIHRIVASDLLVATSGDLWSFAALVVVGAAALITFQRPLRAVTIDPQNAAVLGLPVRRLELATSIAIGIAVGLSIRASGLLYSFGLLVLPAMIARRFCLTLGGVLIVAPVVSLAAGVPAFVLAHGFDAPPAQVCVALLCVAFAACAGLVRLRPR